MRTSRTVPNPSRRAPRAASAGSYAMIIDAVTVEEVVAVTNRAAVEGHRIESLRLLGDAVIFTFAWNSVDPYVAFVNNGLVDPEPEPETDN